MHHADGRIDVYHRGADEPVHGFFRRLVDHGGADDRQPGEPLPTTPALLALLRDAAAPGSEGYALRWDRLSPAQVRRLSAADLVAALAIP